MGQSSRVRLWQTVYSAGEGGVALGVAGAVVRQVPAVEVGAVGAEGTEGVGDDGVGHRSGKPSRWKQRAVAIAAAQRSGVVPLKAVLVDGPAAEPAPEAVDDGGVGVAFDDQDGAGRAAAPAHFAELEGGWVVQEFRGVVRHSVYRLQYNVRRIHL